MGIRTITCVEMACDSCQTRFVDEDHGAVAHFPNRTEALAMLGDYDSWHHDQATDRIVCEPCQSRQICQRQGHDPIDTPYGDRICDRCNTPCPPATSEAVA